MPEIETSRLIYLILLLLMVAGWFYMQNRQGLNKSLQQIAVWGMIFVGVAAGYGLWGDITRNSGVPRQSYETGTGAVTIPRSADGHYYLTALVNGEAIRFVVDTGASDMVLTRQDAERAGLSPDTLNYLGRATTANGEVRTAYVRLSEVQLGEVRDFDVPAVVNDGEMPQSLLGMGYLQRWGRIEIANNELILKR
ncbi:MAG: TIGR02281 family clan AA aspartic protease [Sulfitobacter sp.]|jgi:aspartyl protease family protein|uniref:retropepsin-like aspartic protease family protein n=1 Tax=Sulfitobacter sp. TaxID=1903071 RepID=UPI000C0D7BA8|nr:TIGR02281 family clan AA aspartic protease [Roseobacter sp.]MBV47014.1 TIGR02281 family clan AA aspartic protease [Roseobacter sp.]PHR06810.1 MAG: TIGR02281 family clan AA aspartic protease [Sulfitobacter sp.]|tara:strand:+ start:1479 stop:2063 length:585 start_codon:yes stop_codon:yes gene_type:complete